ncbi:hypothetical protein C7I55_16020 [Sphingomonas deserti]|uniref:DUF3060 domain-containing protein n=2 Tax=Allosphingosinicella deserti TaxID=2116704 RepID=A0A2P7QLI2_9SPHN|nr:hypothetical protein C7I55_16020 [Sphingomonas deserti]
MPALAQADFSGAGATLGLECAGKSATIEGASNTVAITGALRKPACGRRGQSHHDGSRRRRPIRIEGADNEIRWRAPGEAKPRVTIAGAGNRLSRLR